ncbi:helix-turn-helix domain-containing protein [Rummeliibacillus pycnus]|uniref:helix-turn-helix domain-containing protein n=1 Tax=Rummeliibacillus pycnus TaxID=101070 RepID=UPI003D2E1602
MNTPNIGEQLKNLRKERGLTLKELSNKTDFSISFLSQVERGKSNLTLESLRKVSDALQVSPGLFFEKESIEIVPTFSQFHYQDLNNGVHGADFDPILVTLHPGENEGNAFTHEGFEFIYVLSGTFTLRIEEEEITLTAGQSTMFESSLLHYWYNYSEETTRFLVVSSNK